MRTQADKASAFRALHERDGAFIIPNPWDVGTARLLARLGFEALATTSAGYAFSVGQRDNTIGRDEMIAHVARHRRPPPTCPSAPILRTALATIPKQSRKRSASRGRTGLVGGSIEDATNRAGDPIYEHAAGGRARPCRGGSGAGAAFPFTLTARAENYLVGRPDLDDTIKRLQAYQEAGADVLYAPGLTSKDDIAAVVRSVDRPVNVVMGLQGARLDLAELSAIGVKRISVGSALSRAALGAFLRAAREMRETGTFAFADDAVSYADISALLTNE